MEQDADWKHFAELCSRERELTAELDAVKAEKARLEPGFLDQMAEDGMDRLTIGGFTFYPKRVVASSPAAGHDKADVIDALRQSSLADYVTETYNTNSLSSYVRTLAKESDDPDMSAHEIQKLLPAPLREVLKVTEIWKIGVRKG